MSQHSPSLIIGDSLDISLAVSAVQQNQSLELSAKVMERVQACKSYLDKKLEESEVPIYGIDTGFGSLCDVRIDKDSLAQLQFNLVCSHACGFGEEVPEEIVRLMLLFKIQGLSKGHSGVKLDTIKLLQALFVNNITPKVRQLGSLGASGDLAPLAHLSLPLLGEGEVKHNGETKPAEQALKECGLSPIGLEAKEGLALLNGTQFMSAYGATICMRFKSVLKMGLKVMAMSIDAFDGRKEPFDHDLHALRPHLGQQFIAGEILSALKGSELIDQKKEHVQDPYSFRCIPQVVGASRDVLEECLSLFQTEVDSVTDNPTIFPEHDKIISGGNFHGQPLALALDRLAIAMAEVGSISERRSYKLLDGQRGLPSYLVAKAGLNSGFMIIQYTAASIVSQNKQLCTPASVDTLDSSQGQEDHVSMGANAATKAYKVLENLERLVAIELLTAAQALDFRSKERTSTVLQELHRSFRASVPFVEQDTILYPLMDKALDFVRTHPMD